MQWTDELNAGFSRVPPWLPVSTSYKTHNVATESKDPNSILNFYKRLLFLRHHEPALLDGEYVPLNQNDPNVLCYLRRYKDQAVLIVLNMSGSEQNISLDLTPHGLSAPKATALLTTLSRPPSSGDLKPILLEPFSVYIAKLSR